MAIAPSDSRSASRAEANGHLASSVETADQKRPDAPVGRGHSFASFKESKAEREERIAKAVKFAMGPAARGVMDRVRVRSRFTPLYRKLGLSSEQIRRFEDAAAARFSSVDVFNAPIPQGPEGELNFAINLSLLENVVKDTMGPEAVADLRTFIAEGDINDVIARASVQAFSESPLTPEQRAKLVAICMEERRDVGKGRTDIDKINWDQVLGRAESFLDKRQLSAIRNALETRSLDREYASITSLRTRRPIRGM